jgi:hypothetical protein
MQSNYHVVLVLALYFKDISMLGMDSSHSEHQWSNYQTFSGVQGMSCLVLAVVKVN